MGAPHPRYLKRPRPNRQYASTSERQSLLRRGGQPGHIHRLSVLSWLGIGNAYSASKAPLWSATNSLRLELAPRGTLVVGLHLGLTDTPMNAGSTAPMNQAADIVTIALDGIETGQLEILADDISAAVNQNLAAPIETMYPQPQLIAS